MKLATYEGGYRAAQASTTTSATVCNGLEKNHAPLNKPKRYISERSGRQLPAAQRFPLNFHPTNRTPPTSPSGPPAVGSPTSDSTFLHPPQHTSSTAKRLKPHCLAGYTVTQRNVPPPWYPDPQQLRCPRPLRAEPPSSWRAKSCDRASTNSSAKRFFAILCDPFHRSLKCRVSY